MAAHQVPPSLGFSRQEHWSGLPFPSPMRESEVAQSCPTLSDPIGCSLPDTSVMVFSRQEYWSGLPLPSPHLLYTHIESPHLLHLVSMKKGAIAIDESVNCVHHSKSVLWCNYCFKWGPDDVKKTLYEPVSRLVEQRKVIGELSHQHMC